jgi:hypothetical protein
MGRRRHIVTRVYESLLGMPVDYGHPVVPLKLLFAFNDVFNAATHADRLPNQHFIVVLYDQKMTDQLTRIERLLGKILEKLDGMEQTIEKFPDEFYDVKGELDHISEVLRDKTRDSKNFGLGSGK